MLAGLGLAVALLATFAALLAPPLQAQTATVTFVSNTTEPRSTAVVFTYVAQSFETGGEGLGYTISEIQIRLGSVASTRLTVKIREDDAGEPGDEVATLIAPMTFVSNENHTFTAPPGTSLNLNQTYWLTMGEGMPRADIAQMRLTGSDGETAETGWSIGDDFIFRNSAGGSWTTLADSLMISIHGSVERPQSNDTTLSDLALEDASSGDAITLNPGFAPDHFNYAASVRFTVSQVTVTRTKNDPNARIFPLRDGDDNELSDADTSQSGHQVDLVAGAQNVIKVVVQSEAGFHDTYTVTVTRAPEPGEVLLSDEASVGDGR